MNTVAGSSRCSYALLGLPGARVHRLVCFVPLTICGCFVVLQKPFWSAVVLRCNYCSMSFLDFLKVLYFFLVGYAILKNFSYLFDAKFTGDVMTIDQKDSQRYFTPFPTQHCQSFFFPVNL